MSGTSVTISDMHNFVENLGSSDVQISSNIGNVIELGTDGGSLGDDLGFGLLTNSKVMNTGSSNGSSSESRSININSSSTNVAIYSS